MGLRGGREEGRREGEGGREDGRKGGLERMGGDGRRWKEVEEDGSLAQKQGVS